MDTVFTVRYKISVYILFTLILVCQWFSSVQLPTIFATNTHYQPTTVFTAVWIQTQCTVLPACDAVSPGEQ